MRQSLKALGLLFCINIWVVNRDPKNLQVHSCSGGLMAEG